MAMSRSRFEPRPPPPPVPVPLRPRPPTPWLSPTTGPYMLPMAPLRSPPRPPWPKTVDRPPAPLPLPSAARRPEFFTSSFAFGSMPLGGLLLGEVLLQLLQVLVDLGLLLRRLHDELRHALLALREVVLDEVDVARGRLRDRKS